MSGSRSVAVEGREEVTFDFADDRADFFPFFLPLEARLLDDLADLALFRFPGCNKNGQWIPGV